MPRREVGVHSIRAGGFRLWVAQSG